MNLSQNNKSQLSYLCAPALIYLVFSFTQIIIDMFKGLYNTAFLKFLIMIIFTLLLNALCDSGLGIVSWIIVFVPFILMTVITAILLYVFGLDPVTGKLKMKDKTDTYNKYGNTKNHQYDKHKHHHNKSIHPYKEKPKKPPKKFKNNDYGSKY